LSNGEFHFFPPTQASQTISYQKLFGLSLEQIRQSKSSELVQFTIDQRLIKSGEEVAEIERALDITNQLHLLFLHNCKTGATEKSIVGKIHDYLIANDAELAYQCILSERGEVLHNHSYQNTLKANSLVVGDIGAETAAGYASDITRTYPSDRKFVGAQRDFLPIGVRFSKTSY
jgi:Xaa-Pro aminopeptidase